MKTQHNPRSLAVAVAGTLSVIATAAHAADTGPPMNFLVGFGPRTNPVTTLTWGLLIISCAVVVIVCVLLLWGIFRRRPPTPRQSGDLGVNQPPGGYGWIYVGVGVTAIVLLGSTVWTMVTLAAVSRVPHGTSAVSVAVTGHQWWWQIEYDGADGVPTFTTANELHIPVGRPVKISLASTDVIHSFWVPQLSGKTDVIPGQTNTMWFEADRPGTYRGQCAEFCGLEHARMAITVIATSDHEFEQWRAHQAAAVSPPSTDDARTAQNAFVVKCGICHTVRGTPAGGRFGPDLSHLLQRTTLAAGTVPNNPGNLSAWIADPQHIKPGNMMPQPSLTGPELERVRRFLARLD